MKTTLSFPDMEKLFEFKQLTNTQTCKIDARRWKLTAIFTEAQVQLAVDRYGAIVARTEAA